MGDSGVKHSNKKGVRQYFTKTLSYLFILLAITIITAFVAFKPVSRLVHIAEDSVAMLSRDIVLNDEAYKPLSVDGAENIRYEYGDKIANMSSEDFSLNCSIYYGSNRVSMCSGGGFSGKTDLFGSGGVSLVTGYLEGELSGFEHCSLGDTITIVTNYGKIDYRVSDISYEVEDKQKCEEADGDGLVVCALTSDFSSHYGEMLYVFADRVNGEVD